MATVAVTECACADAFQAFGQLNAAKLVARHKCAIADGLQGGGKSDLFEIIAAMECICSNFDNTLAQGDLEQVAVRLEDVGHDDLIALYAGDGNFLSLAVVIVDVSVAAIGQHVGNAVLRINVLVIPNCQSSAPACVPARRLACAGDKDVAAGKCLLAYLLNGVGQNEVVDGSSVERVRTDLLQRLRQNELLQIIEVAECALIDLHNAFQQRQLAQGPVTVGHIGVNDHLVVVNARNSQLGLAVVITVQVCPTVIGQQVGVAVNGISVERAFGRIPNDVLAGITIPVFIPTGQLLVEGDVYVVFGKCILIDRFHGNGQNDVTSVAAGKCVSADFFDAFMNGDAGDIRSAVEQIFGDLGYVIFGVTAENDLADNAADACNACSTVVQQHVYDTVFIGGVFCNAPNHGICSVAVPGFVPTGGYGILGHAGINSAAIESVRANRGNVCGNEYRL